MNQTKLNKRNFLEQITKYGFFAEQFPHCFTSEALSTHLAELTRTVKTSDHTGPSTLSTYKNDISRRIISVPNPESFLGLAIHMKNNWSKVIDAAASKNSLSPIFFINPYYAGRQLINCESLREALRIKSSFLFGIRQSIRISLGYEDNPVRLGYGQISGSVSSGSVTLVMEGGNKIQLKTPQSSDISSRVDEFNFVCGQLIRYAYPEVYKKYGSVESYLAYHDIAHFQRILAD